ncbi:MAG: FAD-binding oxidoreductase [Rhodobacteraceae bacterium]|nr:FAD-binding oxidoreductase [Paracoccaceae bacterium]
MRALVDAPGYFGGAVDSGSGHLHPLKLALGLARAAQSAGVRLFEGSRVTRLLPGDPVRIELDGATVTARFALLAANGYLGGLVPDVAARVMPINNFIVATEPLGKDRASALLPGNHAVGDSRFVINYFRRSPDHRLLFGGGESYGLRFPRDIAALVRRPMEQVFPQLRGSGSTLPGAARWRSPCRGCPMSRGCRATSCRRGGIRAMVWRWPPLPARSWQTPSQARPNALT